MREGSAKYCRTMHNVSKCTHSSIMKRMNNEAYFRNSGYSPRCKHPYKAHNEDHNNYKLLLTKQPFHLVAHIANHGKGKASNF